MRLLAFSMFIFLACKSHKNTTEVPIVKSEFKPEFTAGPQVIVYKTKGDYSKNVPVMLSEDRSKIVAYPDPKDLSTANGYSLPMILEDGYLLDQRGINKNSVFLKLTYDEYAKLEQAPSLKNMNEIILDKDPFAEICNCGNKYAFKDLKVQLNEMIMEKSLLKVCKSLR